MYAVDLQDELIDYLTQKKAALKDSVVQVVKGSEQSPNLPDNSIDLVIMVDVYHELEYPQEMLQSIKKALKKEFGANGFELSYRGDFLPIQHFLLFGKR